MKTKTIGLLILIAVMIAIIAYFALTPEPAQEVNGYLGGEKIGLFEDEEFKEFLSKNYSIDIKYRKAGSIDMVRADKEGMSYLFPASQTALELYKSEIGSPKRSEIILNTPLVLYTHKIVNEALIKEGIVSQEESSYYMDMQKFKDRILAKKTWEDIGLPELYGSISVKTTDPTKSNSGNMFAGLIANSMNGGKVVNKNTVHQVLPKVKEFFNQMGYMDTSSADLFEQFLKMGVGAYPMICAYENQLLEFAVNNPDIWNQIGSDIVIIYPTPTVYSSHVMIALDEKGEMTIDALMDKEVQDIAWEKHGFRTGVVGSTSTTDFNVNGVAPQIKQVMPMPDFDAMEIIINELGK